MPFIIEIPEMANFERKWGTAPAKVRTTMEEAVKAATLVMQTMAKAEAPVKTGKLRAAISFETKGLVGVVYPDLLRTPYALYVHEGTGIFNAKTRAPIAPKNKKVLATKGNPGWGTANKNGYYIIGKSILGQRPNPFMKRAFELGRVKTSTILRVAARDLIKELT